MYSTQIQPRSTEIQPFGATYGQKCLFYGIFGPFLTPMEDLGAISVGPNGPNGPSWMYPTQIQPRSTEIQPFGDTGATYGHKCAFYGIFEPFWVIFGHLRSFMAISGFGGSKWLDLSKSWLDLGGIHPGWSVGAIWTH